MGYLFLSIALLSGAVKGFCGKKMSVQADSMKSAILLNLIRMLLCIAFSLAVILLTGDIRYFIFDLSLLLISVLSGVSTACFVVCWLLVVRKSAYMMVDVFLMLGTLVPIISGYFIFSEPITLIQCAGFILLVIASLLMCSYNNKIKAKLSVSSLILLLACGVANGVTGASQRIFVNLSADTPVSVFNLYTYVFSAITLAIILALLSGKARRTHEDNKARNALSYILIMAAALTSHSYFTTMAAIHLDSAHLYPLNQGASLILSTIMATLFFKEKLTVKAVLGIVLSFVALMIINM